MMPKKLRSWLTISAVLMLMTGALHAVSLFVKTEPANETERQMLDLITSYRMDAGGGFHPSFSNLFTALSSCFSLLCLFGGLLLIYLVRKNLDSGTMKGVLNICLFVFGICFVMMAFFTFLPPIVCTGLILAGLVFSRLAISK